MHAACGEADSIEAQAEIGSSRVRWFRRQDNGRQDSERNEQVGRADNR
jgi:hypothetical protein